MEKVRYLDHESYLKKCDEKFTSCLLDLRLREPIGGSVSLMGDNRFLKLFSKICNFLINDL